MLNKAAIVLSLALLTFGGVAHAQGTPEKPDDSAVKQRFCVDADMVGHVFKMVEFRETPPRRESSWLKAFPYHYLAFYPNRIYSAGAFNSEAKPKFLAKYFERPLKAVPRRYTLDKGGVFNLIENDKVRYSYRCIVMTQDQDEFMKGDLVMTGYTRKKRSELYKVYRRWY